MFTLLSGSGFLAESDRPLPLKEAGLLLLPQLPWHVGTGSV